MAFIVSTESKPSYLVITAAGPAGLGELVGLVALAGAVATHRGVRRALLNLANVEPELLFTEHLQFGVQASGVLGRLEKVAAVVPPGYLDAPSAKAAQLSGLHVRTFLHLADAMAWIQQEPKVG
jgi:hypothetical protein